MTLGGLLMTFLKDIMDKLNNMLIVKFLRKRIVSNIIFAGVFFVVVFFSTVLSLAPEKYELNIGQQVMADIKAPRDIEDKTATNKLIKKAVESVEPREKIDPTIQIDIKKQIERFFTAAYQYRDIQDIDNEEKLISLKEENNLNLTDEELMLVLELSDKELKNIESYIYEIITQVMSTGIKAEELEKERNNITNYFMGLKEFPNTVKSLGINIVNSSIEENRFLDVETTQQKIEEAKKGVEKVIIRSGNIIVRAGETITNEHYEILKEAGMIKEHNSKDLSLYFGIAILIFMAEGLLISYMYVFCKEIFSAISKLYLLLILFVSIYLISKSVYGISLYIVPLAAGTMLIGILINSRLAIVVNLVMTILLALIYNNSTAFILTALIGGTVGACSVTHTHQRVNIFIAGLLVSLSNLLIILGLGFMNNNELSKILIDSFYGVLNGVFCAILTIGSLPLWESAFGILTPLKMLELSNPNQPILKRLLLEAPGTYHHSIIVGNLSEAAADAIDANGLFARVSSYYHDIGKLKRPYFFKENQLTCENPHDKITSSLSALIITNHVKDGIEIARKHKIPQEIVEIIEQHHGTTLVKYFYHKAMNDGENETIDEDNFRYNGVRPQSKEAAIVMLADSVEAAVRSMPEPTSEKIKSLVDKIINDKLKDHQLDECDLTLKDMERIASSFCTVLMGIFHERIEYPDLNVKETEGA